MALRLKMPVYFMYVRKTSPQHYEAELQRIYDGEEAVAPHEITERLHQPARGDDSGNARIVDVVAPTVEA